MSVAPVVPAIEFTSPRSQASLQHPADGALGVSPGGRNSTLCSGLVLAVENTLHVTHDITFPVPSLSHCHTTEASCDPCPFAVRGCAHIAPRGGPALTANHMLASLICCFNPITSDPFMWGVRRLSGGVGPPENITHAIMCLWIVFCALSPCERAARV